MHCNCAPGQAAAQSAAQSLTGARKATVSRSSACTGRRSTEPRYSIRLRTGTPWGDLKHAHPSDRTGTDGVLCRLPSPGERPSAAREAVAMQRGRFASHPSSIAATRARCRSYSPGACCSLPIAREHKPPIMLRRVARHFIPARGAGILAEGTNHQTIACSAVSVDPRSAVNTATERLRIAPPHCRVLARVGKLHPPCAPRCSPLETIAAPHFWRSFAHCTLSTKKLVAVPVDSRRRGYAVWKGSPLIRGPGSSVLKETPPPGLI